MMISELARFAMMLPYIYDGWNAGDGRYFTVSPCLLQTHDFNSIARHVFNASLFSSSSFSVPSSSYLLLLCVLCATHLVSFFLSIFNSLLQLTEYLLSVESIILYFHFSKPQREEKKTLWSDGDCFTRKKHSIEHCKREKEVWSRW